MSQIKRVTVVNDHPEFLALMADFLGDEGYEVTTIPKHQGAFDQIKQSSPDVVICDLMMPRLTTCRRARSTEITANAS